MPARSGEISERDWMPAYASGVRTSSPARCARLPPLRERKEDITLLTDYYLNLFSRQYGKQEVIIRGDTRNKLEKYHWPGNIRELAHTIERAVIMCKGGVLNPDDFVLKIKTEPVVFYDDSIVRVEDYERKAIANALSKNSGNLSKAADDLGVARTTLYRKISRFGIESWK
jgi:two-component system response regulator HydG